MMDFAEEEIMEWQWYQLDHMQVIYTSFHTGNHARTSSLKFLWAGWRMLFLLPEQQRQSTEAVSYTHLTLPTNREV